MPDCVTLPHSLKKSAAKPLRIVLTGSECTGKSTLAAMLAKHYKVECVEEYLREYFIAHNGVLTLEDAVPIAKGQIAAEDAVEDAMEEKGADLLLCDTNILSSVVYNKHYYGTNPEWIEEAFTQREYTLYLLCGIDVPWEADGQRDMPEEREYMQGLFRAELEERNLPFVELTGDANKRFECAVTLIDSLS